LFFRLAILPEVVHNAVKVSLVVGTLLAIINHGDAIMHMEMPAQTALKIVLSYLVPYCVSTYSAVKVLGSTDTS